MDDLIARNRLLREIREVYEYEFPTASGDFDRFVRKILPNIICNQQTVDAIPVIRGYWERFTDGDGFACCRCSKCHVEWFGYSSDPYCSNCGAKMDEEYEQK